MNVTRGEVRKLQLYGGLFRCLTRTFKSNSLDSANLYEKKAIKRLISDEFAIADTRAINSKFEFCLTKKFIFASARGYSINPKMEEFYNEFKEKYRDLLDELNIDYE